MTCLSPDELREQIVDNIDYLYPPSIAKARAFEKALSIYLMLKPEEQEDQHNKLRYDLSQLRMELDRVREWLAMNDQTAGSRVAFFSAANYRNRI